MPWAESVLLFCYLYMLFFREKKRPCKHIVYSLDITLFCRSFSGRTADGFNVWPTTLGRMREPFGLAQAFATGEGDHKTLRDIMKITARIYRRLSVDGGSRCSALCVSLFSASFSAQRDPPLPFSGLLLFLLLIGPFSFIFTYFPWLSHRLFIFPSRLLPFRPRPEI